MSRADQVASAAGDAVLERGMQKDKPLLTCRAEGLRAIMEAAKEAGFDHLACLTGIDWPADQLAANAEWLGEGAHLEGKEDGLVEVAYNLYSYDHKEHLAVQCWAPRDVAACKVPSVADLWPGADWHEREAYDLYGVTFDGHPNLKRIFMPEEWTGHPGRRDYDLGTEQFIYRDGAGEDRVTFDPGKGW